MATHFTEKLVLARWALGQLGIEDIYRLSSLLRAPEYEGWAEDGGSKFIQQLIARLPITRALSDEQLREYDSNIVGHWKHITRNRNLQGQTLYPIYFQYVSLLLTECYLDRYFRDQRALLVSLNQAVEKFNQRAGVREA